MIKAILILLLICVAVAYWKWVLGAVIVLVAIQIFRSIAKAKQSSTAPASKQIRSPTGEYDADTNLKMKHGYRQFIESQDADLLDVWPCQELLEDEVCNEPCNWPERWVQAGGKLYAGRMIARKDDPIWLAISRFNLPYPPFDFGSGMGVRDIDRSESESLGIIKRSTVIKSIC